MIAIRQSAMKANFFDRTAVIKQLDQKLRKVLGYYGGYIRKSARNSIKRAKPGEPPSSPGDPPKSRTGLLKDRIYYAYDMGARSVVIGPEKLNAKSGPDIPRTLEEGGTMRVRKGGRWVTVTIAARPYMGPAAKAGEKKRDEIWGSV